MNDDLILKPGNARMKGRFSEYCIFDGKKIEYKTIIISYLIPFYPAVFHLN